MDRRGIVRRIAIPITTSIFILLLFVCIPMVSANAHGEITALAYQVIPSTTPSMQGTPTVDPTITALQKEQLTEQVDRSLLNWIWNYGASALSTLALLGGGIFAFLRWIGDRRDARKKQAEERFKSVVEGLGDTSPDKKIASAVLLRTFLGSDYKEFYTQVFDLAVANLRRQDQNDSSGTEASKPLDTPSSLQKQGLTTPLNVFLRRFLSSSEPPTKPSGSLTQEVTGKKTLKTRDSFSLALITAFKEAFPRAREELEKQLEKQGTEFKPQLLDAARINLELAYLYRADLRNAWMTGSSLKEADLTAARLNPIQLEGADLSDAKLNGAVLSGATLIGVDLRGADLTNANLSGADLTGAKLGGANLTRANLIRAILTQANPEEAKLLEGARMYNVEGLSSSTKELCERQGAKLEYKNSSSLTNKG